MALQIFEKRKKLNQILVKLILIITFYRELIPIITKNVETIQKVCQKLQKTELNFEDSPQFFRKTSAV